MRSAPRVLALFFSRAFSRESQEKKKTLLQFIFTCTVCSNDRFFTHRLRLHIHLSAITLSYKNGKKDIEKS